MAQLAFPPGFRVTDADDEPLSGALLYFYDADGTSDRTVYQDPALSSAHAQPVVCGSDGLVPAIYVPTGEYRVKGFTSGGSPISGFDYDNIDGPIDTAALSTTEAKPLRAITTKTSTETLASSLLGGIINANPGGGTFTLTLPAASAGNGKQITIRNIGSSNAVIVDGGASSINGDDSRILPNKYDAETYVSDGADWHVDTTPTEVPNPQGRLTLESGEPFPNSDQANKTTVYWAFDVGDLCPVKYGSELKAVRATTEPSLALTSDDNLANTIYDVFAFLNSGTLTLGTVAWSTSTAGSGARGTGGSTPELTRFQGLLVNANAITARNNGATYAVAANEGTYLGSLFIDGTAGQVTTHTAYGQTRKYGVWNAYNRRNIILRSGDTTSNWTAATSTGPTNADSDNKSTPLIGLADQCIEAKYLQKSSLSIAGGSTSAYVNGIGWNSTSAISGGQGDFGLLVNSSNHFQVRTGIAVFAQTQPAIGIHDVQMLEDANGSSADSANGGEDNCLMTVSYWG